MKKRYIALMAILILALGGASLRGMASRVANSGDSVHPKAQENTVSPGDHAAAKAMFKAIYDYRDVPTGLAPMAFTDMDGKPVSASDFKGEVVVLNIWATWCAPCVDEMPTFVPLMRAYGDKGLRVMAASADFEMAPSRIRNFMKKIKAEDVPVLKIAEDGPVWEILSVGLPVTFVIGRDGTLLYKMHGGADWSHPDIMAFIGSLLAQPATLGKN